ncbi:MAG: S46 family peptidase [Myxococcales bacterium]|nr:S46 family peptidase [Myxococcales bacterium]
MLAPPPAPRRSLQRLARLVRLVPLVPLAVGGCGPAPSARPPSPAPSASASSAGPRPEAVTPTFENPGGMWMPTQMVAHEATLRRLGVAFEPKLLADPSSPLLSSIVSLGGCSASFVSDGGLVITNHHCATGALSFNSTPETNLLRDGTLARSRAEERSNGPEARVLVTQKLTDVSTKVLEGVADDKDDLARYRRVERRSKELVAACEAGRPELRCTLASYYAGTVYVLIEQLELRDVRLVYAPPAGVGNYGGEIDNWRWPRHTGDVAIFRAYVGRDGKPAGFSPTNVPYKPAHHLRVASTPLRAGDLVLVAGYPGRTQSWRSGPEVDEAIGWSYPRRQRFCEDALAALEVLGATSPEVKLKATPYVRRYGNWLTNTRGQLEGLVKGGLAHRKAEDEAKLAAFITDEPGRKARFGDVLGELREAVAEHAKSRDADAQLHELLLPKLVSAAVTIVRTAKERERPDAERHPDYQERNLARHERELRSLEKTYSRPLDQGLLRLALTRIARSPEAERTSAVSAVVGGGDPEKAIAALYATTRLEDTEQRLKLLQRAQLRELVRSKDPLIALAVRLVPMLVATEEREHRFEGRMLTLKSRYVAARRELAGRELAPDANGTLRVTFGTVRGFSPGPGKPVYRPFTTLTEMLAKDTRAEPFAVPPGLAAAAAMKKLGPYVDARLGDVPVDFLADLHITGGNSGSATLDARGELTGLVFDGNYEAMAADWLFMPELTRSIHVDIRYVTWLLDAVAGGDHLLRELGVKPSID